MEIELFFKNIYQNFNNRKIDLVINEMTDDVQWANGMDGGYVLGRDEVMAYWTRQFKLVNSNVTPLNIDEENDVVKLRFTRLL